MSEQDNLKQQIISKPFTLKTPSCPTHGQALEVQRDSNDLWKCVCHHVACTKAGYGWTQSEAYLDFHRANNIK